MQLKVWSPLSSEIEKKCSVSTIIHYQTPIYYLHQNRYIPLGLNVGQFC